MTNKWKYDLEYLSYVGDLLATEEVQKLGIHATFHSTRLDHSISVSYYSYKITKKFGWNATTARAGVLMIYSFMIGVQLNLMRERMPYAS